MAGFAAHRLPRNPAGPQPSLIVAHRLGMAIETDYLAVVRGGELPRVAVEGPVIGMLNLIAILENLLEDPELIPDAITHRRYVQGRQRIEQAGGQPSQAPVPQPRLHIAGLESIKGYTEAGKRLAGQAGGAGVQGILAKLAAQHVLRRQVINKLRVGHIMRLGRPGPALREAVPDGDGQRPISISQARRLDRRPPLVVQVVGEVALEIGHRVAELPDPWSRAYGAHEPNVTQRQGNSPNSSPQNGPPGDVSGRCAAGRRKQLHSSTRLTSLTISTRSRDPRPCACSLRPSRASRPSRPPAPLKVNPGI
jgi:hypothetical protein